MPFLQDGNSYTSGRINTKQHASFFPGMQVGQCQATCLRFADGSLLLCLAWIGMGVRPRLQCCPKPHCCLSPQCS